MAAPRVSEQRGFTLLELLVAIAIFAVVAALAMGGYVQLQKQNEHTQQTLERVSEIQRAVQMLTQDFEQLEPRPVREPLGDGRSPALLADAATEYRVQLTRAGWSNTAGLPRPDVAARRLSGRPGWPVARHLAGARSHADGRADETQAAG